MPRPQLLQALMTFFSTSSNSLISASSEPTTSPIFSRLVGSSLSSFLALSFWSSLFCFCLGVGFCQPYYHLPLTRVSISFMVRATLYMLFDAFFAIQPFQKGAQRYLISQISALIYCNVQLFQPG